MRHVAVAAFLQALVRSGLPVVQQERVLTHAARMAAEGLSELPRYHGNALSMLERALANVCV